MTRFLALLGDSRRWRLVMVLVFVIGAGWTLLSRAPVAGSATSALRTSPQEGFLAPDFTLDSLAGNQVTLSALRGKVVLVNLWASWCGPCRAEMPAIDRVYRANRSRGFDVLAVDASNQDSESDARAFVEKLGLTFPILLDRTGSVGQRYLLRALPTSFFIDRRGVIRSVMVGGPMSEALISTKIEDLLQEAP
jgi:cytochrome c biogenesis protein CcmG, thiol:disulfide interchange protein DsbE